MRFNDIPPPPDWPIERKREFVAYYEEMTPEKVTDDLVDGYEAIIVLERCWQHYGVIAISRDHLIRHCCNNNHPQTDFQ